MELLKENDPRLLEISTEWDFTVDEDPTELVKNMGKFMVENGGVGLAAPQLGINKRIFIMGNFQKLVACINPKIVNVGEERLNELEGCLSFPGLFMKVKRPASINVEYQNTSNETVQRELTGLESRVFLHEYDHLIGVTFNQRVSDLVLRMAKDKRKKELKRESKRFVSLV